MSANANADTDANANGAASAAGADPLVRLAALPGVAEAVDAARAAVDRLHRHRVMRRRAPEVAAEAALRGARASAALAGADWPLEEVRRRSDFGGDAAARTVGAALRLNAEAGQLTGVWRGSPTRVLARLHLVAAGGGGVPAATVGRPRLAGEAVADQDGAEGAGAEGAGTEAAEVAQCLGEPPDAREVAARLDAVARLVVGGSAAPALVTAAVVHGELLALRPFVSHNALVARAAQRIALIAGGLDVKAVAPAEVGHAEAGRAAYLEALAGYASGSGEGMARWIGHCARAVELGVRESAAVCEALQRGAAA
ncbi:oxidoreductase [Streptomyces sp. 6N223]|uniref:oxidoreductase n=1 Tax=Streptomyces sp. 6N223 TaxID=3457412 RepID=UPI003FD23E31